GTIASHLALESMRGWYALDEGGPSAPGNWMKVKSNWKVEKLGPKGAFSATATPHAWAMAELHLLLRDALAYEDGDRLILFAGVPAEWFRQPIHLHAFPTHFGPMNVDWQPGSDGKSARLSLTGLTISPSSIVLALHDHRQELRDWSASITVDLQEH